VKAFFWRLRFPLYFRGLEKGKRQRESWEGAGVDPAVFAIQLSILNRMSFLAGFAELERPAALTVRAPSLQLPKRGIRHESRIGTSPVMRNQELALFRMYDARKSLLPIWNTRLRHS